MNAPPPHFYKEQGAQRLKAFTLGVIKVNDKHAIA